MSRIIFAVISLFLEIPGSPRENKDTFVKIAGINFEVLCNKVSSDDKIHLDFVVKISNYSQSTIKIPSVFIVAPQHETEGNIGFELDYINIDTISLSDSFEIDMVPPDSLYKKKIELKPKDVFLKEISLPYSDFSKNKKYRIRFCLRGNFIEPVNSNLFTNWYYFAL